MSAYRVVRRAVCWGVILGALLLMWSRTRPRDRGDPRGHSPETSAVPAVARLGVSPPAPPGSFPDPPVYDRGVDVLANVRALHEACRSVGDAPGIKYFFTDLARGIVEQAPGRAAELLPEAKDSSNHPYYRCVLLTALSVAEPVGQEDLFWNLALDADEDIRVRQEAIQSLRRLDRFVQRPDDMLWLLQNLDDHSMIFALKLAPRHLNATGYAYVKQLIVEADDINVRLCALNAAAAAAFDDREGVLRTVLAAESSSKEEPFSDASLMKRLAVSRLDPAHEDNLDLARNLAADPAEEPGVRGRAIDKCAEEGTPETARFIASLLPTFGDQDSILLKAAIEALIRIGDDEGRRAAAARIAGIEDAEIREYFELVWNRTTAAHDPGGSP